MAEIILHGIQNCDAVRRARGWLHARGLAYRFHDLRKDGIDQGRLARWSEAAGWERLLNRRGTTFRKLPEEARADLDCGKALRLMAAHPALIKRPVVEYPGGLLVGFDEAEWTGRLT